MNACVIIPALFPLANRIRFFVVMIIIMNHLFSHTSSQITFRLLSNRKLKAELSQNIFTSKFTFTVSLVILWQTERHVKTVLVLVTSFHLYLFSHVVWWLFVCRIQNDLWVNESNINLNPGGAWMYNSGQLDNYVFSFTHPYNK